jgi:hypothetical protein
MEICTRSRTRGCIIRSFPPTERRATCGSSRSTPQARLGSFRPDLMALHLGERGPLLVHHRDGNSDEVLNEVPNV